jgi:hypothetical protein
MRHTKPLPRSASKANWQNFAQEKEQKTKNVRERKATKWLLLFQKRYILSFTRDKIKLNFCLNYTLLGIVVKRYILRRGVRWTKRN